MKASIDPWVRVTIMLVATGVVALLSYSLTGSVLPVEPRQALVFQNALLLIVLGSALLEHHFTKPADSAVNALMGLITLFSVHGEAPTGPWTIAAGYCSVVFILSATCVAVSQGAQVSGWRKRVARFTYRPSVVFGRARVLFTVVFLSGLWFFYTVQDPVTIALILFWGVFLAIWPLKIPELVTAWFRGTPQDSTSVGEILRIDSPNILRVAFSGESTWDPSLPKICVQPNGESYWVKPLFSQFQEGRLLATGLLTSIPAPKVTGQRNCVLDPCEVDDAPEPAMINRELGGGEHAALVGYVIERSTIRSVRFETVDSECCYNGMLVWSELGGKRVYYQIVSGETQEESFSTDKHGFHVATAVQLGTLRKGTGFERHDWLPAMNTPVFSVIPGRSVEVPALADDDFRLGAIPNTGISVGGDFVSSYNHHTAILGVTGSGKTELAFDLVRHTVAKGIKVVCIDLTAQYEKRLGDMNPVDLTVSKDTSDALTQKLFDAETGTYGAGAEKKALGEFAETLRSDISHAIKTFLEDRKGPGIGLIRLEEISNTKATLWITELFMTCLLKYSRENTGSCPRTLRSP
jgi:uncharacterized protein